MGSSCVKFNVHPASDNFHAANQTEPNFGISSEDREMNQMAMSGQFNAATDATERDKPTTDTTSQKLTGQGEQSKAKAQIFARNALKYDCGMRHMADKVNSQFNYFPPFTKNGDL